MVLDAQPLEDEADYGRLIELEGRGDFSEEKLPRPPKTLGLPNPCPRFSVLYGWEKGGGGKADP